MARSRALVLVALLIALACIVLPASAQASTSDLTISSGTTTNVSVSGTDPVTFTPTAPGAVLNVSDLQNALASANVVVGSQSTTSTITIDTPIDGSGSNSLDFEASDAISLAGGDVMTGGAQAYDAPVTLDSNTTISSTGSGNVMFSSTIDGGYGLTVNTAGPTSFNAAVGGAMQLTSLALAGSGLVILNGGSVDTTGGQSFGGPVVLGTNVSLSAGSGIRFSSTVDGAASMTIDQMGGETSFDGAVGANTPLSALFIATPTPIAISGGAITTTGSQDYEGSVTVSTDTAATSTGGGSITFGSAVTGASRFTVSTSGPTTFDGPVGQGGNQLAGLDVDGSGPIILQCGSVTTSGAQTFDGPVTLGADTSVNSINSGVTFSSTVDGSYGLTVNGEGSSFNGPVGSLTPLTKVTANGAITLVAGSVTTTGNQTYNDHVSLGANTDLNSTGSGSLVFASTVDGPFALAMSGSGPDLLQGELGSSTPLTSFVADGPTAITGGVFTSGDQTYGEAVTLNSDATLSSALGSISSSSPVSLGSNSLTLDGAGSLSNEITGSGSLTKAGSGTLDLSGANTYSGGTSVTGGLVQFSSLGNFGSGDVALDGGGLQWAADTTVDVSPQLSAIGSGGATFDTNGNDVALASPLTGSGPVTKQGAGALTLSASNPDSAQFDVQGGSLDVTGSWPGLVKVEPSGTLSCDGGTLSGGVENDGGSATGAPAAPSSAAAQGNGDQATVSFTPGAANCFPVSYTATSSPGDQQASGTASPLTVRGLSAGTAYTFAVTASNPIGSSSPSASSGAVTTPSSASPPVTGGSPPPTVSTPLVTDLSQSRSTWREASKLARVNRQERSTPVGTTFSFLLNGQAAVSFKFVQILSGRRLRNGRCAARTSRNEHRRKCSLTLTRATLVFIGKQGLNTVIFQGWLSATSKLAPGRYVLLVAATAGGKSSRPATLRFTIVKP